MDAIGDSLAPYKDLIGQIASFLTIAQFFSGSFICNDIRKNRSSENISSVPFIGGVMMGLATLRYSIMLQDSVMFNVNIAAIVLNAVYCVYYYMFSPSKWDDMIKPMSYGMAFVAVLFGYCAVESKENVEFRYGLILTVVSLVLLGNPLLGIKEMIDSKDASQIPFVLTFMGTIVTFTWLLYALILKNNFMILQNVIGFFLCVVQLILVFKYPGKHNTPTKKKKQ